MARILVVLVSVSLALNVLTFLFVVTQEPEGAAGKASADTATRPTPQKNPEVQALSLTLRTVQKDVKALLVKLGSVVTKVDRLSENVREVTESLSGEEPPPINTGDREFPFSEAPEKVDPGGTPVDSDPPAADDR